MYHMFSSCIRALKRAINQLSTPSRTRVMIVLICCVGAKNDLFPIFVKVISRKPLDLHS